MLEIRGLGPKGKVPEGLPQFCNVGRDIPLATTQGADKHWKRKESSEISHPNTSASQDYFIFPYPLNNPRKANLIKGTLGFP